MISAGGKRVEGQIKLVFPAKFEAGFRHGVIAKFVKSVPLMTFRCRWATVCAPVLFRTPTMKHSLPSCIRWVN